MLKSLMLIFPLNILWHDQIIAGKCEMVAKFYTNFYNNNEVNTHQGMDSRHMQKSTVLTKIALREHYT